jgi:hypothetical protein
LGKDFENKPYNEEKVSAIDRTDLSLHQLAVFMVCFGKYRSYLYKMQVEATNLNEYIVGKLLSKLFYINKILGSYGATAIFKKGS